MPNPIPPVSKPGRSLRRDRSGVTAMEYGLIAALVAVVIITAVTNIGERLEGVFTTIENALPAPAAPGT